MEVIQGSANFNNDEVNAQGNVISHTLNIHVDAPIQHVQRNGVELEIIDETVNVEVPVNTSELNNDSGFITPDYHDNSKQDKLEAGYGITLEGNTISSYSSYGMPNKIVKNTNYLFEAYYNSIDYNYATNWFNERNPIISGGCSVFTKGNYVGRNFDWYYDNEAEFFVSTSKIEGCHSVIGVAGGVGITANDISYSNYDERMKLLPFFMRDGLNDSGLFMEVNVVPNDYGTQKAIPNIENRYRINALMLIRFVLDRFSTVDEAVDFLKKYVEVYFSNSLEENNYELHWLLRDYTKSVVLEVVNNEFKVTESVVSTNFHLYNITTNETGTVYTPADAPTHTASENGITEYGSGLERFNLIVTRYRSLINENDIKELLRDLKFTNAYSTSASEANPKWYSEFVGDELTVNSPANNFSARYSAQGEKYRTRSRNGETWQTTHSAIYNVNDFSLKLFTQEDFSNYKEYFLDVEKDYVTQEEFEAGLAEKQDIISDLNTIRSGATLGTTSIQPNDNLSALTNDVGFITSSYHDSTKVDIVEGKGLSTNDYTNAEKAIVANAVVSSDLAEVAFSGSYNDLIDTPTIPSAQIQSDWNQTDTTKADFIKNKPNIGTLYTAGDGIVISNNEIKIDRDVTATVDYVDGSITNTIAYLEQQDTNEYLGRVAGDNLLDARITTIENKIPSQASSSNQLADKSFVNSTVNSLAAFFRGSFNTYADLLAYTGEKTNNDYAYVVADETHSNEGWRYIYVVQAGETTGTWNAQFKVNDTPFTAQQLANINSSRSADSLVPDIEENAQNITTLSSTKQDKITVSNKLDYSLLDNTPTIPTVPTNVSSFVNDSNYQNGTQVGNAISTALSDYTPTSSLATVATSGNYNDLSNKPTIPSIEGLATTSYVDSAVSLKQNIIDSNNKLNADYVNDGNSSNKFVTGAEKGLISTAVQPNQLATVATSGDYEDLSNVPTNLSDFTNDSDFQSGTQVGNAISTALSSYTPTNQLKNLLFLNTDTSSSATPTLEVQKFYLLSGNPTAISLNKSGLVNGVVNEWSFSFTTGSSQTGVTISTSGSDTISWNSDITDLEESTKYVVSVIGNDTVGYIGNITSYEF